MKTVINQMDEIPFADALPTGLLLSQVNGEP